MSHRIDLYEYQNTQRLPPVDEDFLSFLDEIWNRRERAPWYESDDEARSTAQRFLNIHPTSREVRSNKYVGVIHYNGTTINLLPKIFYEQGADPSAHPDRVAQMHNHIMWWLGYCRRVRFPSYQTSLGRQSDSFFEVLIYLFAKYTRELLFTSVYQQYEDQQGEVRNVKGRLDVPTYVSEHISRGQWHKLHCVYDSFEIDNELNRIIKYVAGMLAGVSGSEDNRGYLQQILFMLDEVSDITATAQQCARLRFNPMFGEYETVRDYCQLFLSNSISIDYNNSLRLFAFLLPMEYVFEDFIFGFLDRELPGISVSPQSTAVHLDEARSFQLRPDLIIESGGKHLVIDTKYKLLYNADATASIAQSDLYQILAYAVRLNIDHGVLLYPGTVRSPLIEQPPVVILDNHADGRPVNVHIHQVPVHDADVLAQPLSPATTLDELFAPARERLKEAMERMMGPED